jgi:hypothetical protein
MSSLGIDMPQPDDLDYHADLHEARRRLALAKIHPEDLLASVMEDLAERPLPGHPLEPLILWLLDRAWTPGDGGELWDHLKAAVTTQIDQLVDEALARGED